jgi:hypothetical protein
LFLISIILFFFLTLYYKQFMEKEHVEIYVFLAHMGERRNVYRVLVGKPEGKRPLGRPRRRWKDGIKIDLREMVEGGCIVDPPGSG